jgi:hypothetical protein
MSGHAIIVRSTGLRRHVHESATPRFVGRLCSRARRLVSFVNFHRSLQPGILKLTKPV